MSRSTIRRWTELMLLLAAVGSVTAMLAGAPSALATASYADATGQRCAACHVGQPSQAVLTAEGQRFAAVPTHRTDPAGAWTMVAGAASPTVPGQAPAQLPRTGDEPGSGSPLGAAVVGLVLLVVGSLIVTRGRHGVTRRRRGWSRSQ